MSIADKITKQKPKAAGTAKGVGAGAKGVGAAKAPADPDAAGADLRKAPKKSKLKKIKKTAGTSGFWVL